MGRWKFIRASGAGCGACGCVGLMEMLGSVIILLGREKVRIESSAGCFEMSEEDSSVGRDLQ